jgi:sialate O-acetylesterase
VSLWQLFLWAAIPLPAAITLPALVGDQMVLQRDEPLRIWGRGAPGEAVTVRLGETERKTVTAADGKWQLFLPPRKAGGPFPMRIAGTNVITLQDVYVGEVWLASGQSNMEWRIKHSAEPEKTIAGANHPLIRLFHVPHRIIDMPQEDVAARWEICSPQTVPDFSAAAYWFGRHLHEKLGVPIGLIEAARGGTPAEAWIGQEALHSHPDLQYYVQQGKRPPMRPGSSSLPSGLFNGMIAPLTPYAIRGFLWYQGETNASRAESRFYRTLFGALIADWRERWGMGPLPFLYVQLANYGGAGTEPGTEWVELREAQRETLAVAGTAMVVTNDIGDTVNIHPKNKRDVGERLALAARAVAYGEKLVHSGPHFRRATQEGDTLRLWFDFAESGLRSRAAETLEGFVIAGEDRVFHPALARIDGQTIVVSAAAVPRPLAVRYAWTPAATASFANAEGLPPSPFRTDRWTHATMPTNPRPVFGKGGWTAERRPGYPNVLLIGDSISVGYTREVRHLLRDAANVFRPVVAGADQPENCQSTLTGLERLDKWLGAEKWDVIHFNWGLHDLCYRHPDSKDPGKRDKVNGKISVPLADYERNLTELVGRLQKTTACLVFANTTFVPEGELGRVPGDEKRYNEVAARVMEKAGIPVTDLYTSTSRFAPEMFLGPGNVHFGPKANWLLGEQVADSVRTAIGRCKR